MPSNFEQVATRSDIDHISKYFVHKEMYDGRITSITSAHPTVREKSDHPIDLYLAVVIVSALLLV